MKRYTKAKALLESLKTIPDYRVDIGKIVSIKNKDVIKEPTNITKKEKINITMPKDKLIALNIFVKKHNTNRSKVLTALTNLLLDNRIKIDELKAID